MLLMNATMTLKLIKDSFSFLILIIIKFMLIMIFFGYLELNIQAIKIFIIKEVLK